MPDLVFAEPRLAQIFDALDPDRSDLHVYAAMVSEFGARSVLDIGCGTGTFACMLASRGIEVVAADPARASLDVARSKPNSSRVQWLQSDASHLPSVSVDMAIMTGNVAQVFITDKDWEAALASSLQAVRPTVGRLEFETRDPAQRAWETWTPELTRDRTAIPSAGIVDHWHELLDVDGEFVTFRSIVVFAQDGAILESHSTLRFRQRESIEISLVAAGFTVDEIRDAPDRPGREFVFIARRVS